MRDRPHVSASRSASRSKEIQEISRAQPPARGRPASRCVPHLRKTTESEAKIKA